MSSRSSLMDSLGYGDDELSEACPWCWQEVALPIDPCAREDELYTDCTVCCRPLVLRTSWHDGELRWWRLQRGE